MGDIVTFDPPPPPPPQLPPPPPQFIQKGSKIEHPDVLLIFWGPYWPGSGSLTTTAIMQAIRSIVSGPYLDGLKQYGYVGPTTVRNEMIVSSTPTIDPSFQPFPTVYGDNVHDFIYDLLKNDAIDNVDDNHDLIVMVFLDPSIPLPAGASGANGTIEKFEFLDDNTRFEYSWIATAGLSIQDISKTFSHELVESISDPFNSGVELKNAPPPNPNSLNEIQICDVCNQPATIGGAGVAAYWSIQDNACIIPTPGSRRVNLTYDIKILSQADSPVQQAYVDLGQPLCAAGYFDYVERTFSNRIIVTANIAGYESPILVWTINGNPVPLATGTMDVDATWEEPPRSKFTIFRAPKPTATLHTLRLSSSATQITIGVGPNEGNVTLGVGCSVFESFDDASVGGRGTTIHNSAVLIGVQNQSLIWGQAYQDAKKACQDAKHKFVGPGGGIRLPKPGDPPDLAQVLYQLLTENGPNANVRLKQAAQLIRNFNNEVADALITHAKQSSDDTHR